MKSQAKKRDLAKKILRGKIGDPISPLDPLFPHHYPLIK